ncbi:MAG: hypothetical protein RIT02_1466, partial [Planctomycetota bacterium]
GRGSRRADKPPREGEAPAEPTNPLARARLQPSRKPPSGGRGSRRADKPLGRARLQPSRNPPREGEAPAEPQNPLARARLPPSPKTPREGEAPPKPHIHQPDKPVGSAGASPARRKKNLRPETLFSGSFQFSLEHSLTTIAAPLTCADSEKTKKKTREAAFPSLSDFQFETTAHRLSTQDCTIAAGLTSRHKASSINCCSIDCSPDTPGTSVGTCVATGSIGAASGRPRSIAAA